MNATLATAWRTAQDLQPSLACRCSLLTCSEEAIPERCACLDLLAGADVACYPLPSFLRQPLAAGETALSGAPTVVMSAVPHGTPENR